MTDHDIAVENFYNLHNDEKNNYITGFEEGCEYKSKQLIDKACEWLKENIYNRVYKCNDSLGFPTATFIGEFKKAMEDKQ